MIDLEYLFVRRPRAIRVIPFTPEMADKVDDQGNKPIHYIKTREGMRHISEGMLIAFKSDTYRHPMDPAVFQREYVGLTCYDSAYALELREQLADQLRGVMKSDDPMADLAELVEQLSTHSKVPTDEHCPTAL
ncbi:hypothetical protein TW86_03780 [Halomonas sp. S2151]|uniref:hypothetical protein n=1 Tax=Halomonas sp. S2151 TaxID=579478 RepID=UPI0005FA4787|nr:hypothetical protein [Halomonas sp. S2151]KJZ17386.1 hypothetical protein TW86_03780 [Halomonas sp. S2151]